MNQRLYFLERWDEAAENLGIPRSAFQSDVKVVSSDSANGFKFAVIHNPNRFERPMPSKENEVEKDCILCGVLDFTAQEEVRNLNPKSSLINYTVVANKFPTMRGHSLAIENGVKNNEREIYSTKNLGRFGEDMIKLFPFAQERGLQAYHNGEGAGASIPRHEHWHFTNWKDIYDKAGSVCGFDDAQHERTNTSREVGFVSNFPFAHLVFNETDPERIVNFLDRMGKEFNSKYERGFVPHVVCQGERGILIIPYKKHNVSGGIGSGDVAGHLVCKTAEEFDRADYRYCINRLGESLFKKNEINLEALL